MMGWDYGWGGTMMFGSVLLWGGLIVLLVWLLLSTLQSRARDASGTGDNTSSSSAARRTPLELLQERYAKGEISREEYMTMRQDLESK